MNYLYKKIYKFNKSFFIFMFSINSCIAMPGEDFEPPKYSAVDDYGVNVDGLNIVTSTETVSIGGEDGLTHSVSPISNNFWRTTRDAYVDAYAGKILKIKLGNGAWIDGVKYEDPSFPDWSVKVLNVHALGDGHRFKVYNNGSLSQDASFSSSSTFESMGDPRHTLAYQNDRYVWTKPDGTKVYFWGTGFNKIVFPNGYTINVGSTGVTNNRGYQIKYEYLTGTTSGWDASHPKKIVGINSAVEYCSMENISDVCDLSNDWPTARINWHFGAPNTFTDPLWDPWITVTDSKGGVTRFDYEVHDISLNDPHDPNSGKRQSNFSSRYTPRLTKVTYPGATASSISYTYENDFVDRGSCGHNFGCESIGDWDGTLKKVSGVLGTSSYGYTLTQWGARTYWGHQGRTVGGGSPGTLSLLEVKANKLTFEDSEYNSPFQYRNFPKTSINEIGQNIAYIYDTRGNLTSISNPSRRAGYPSTCSNRKICNRPQWTEDAYGNRTDYTYHPESGQIATMTAPANEFGLKKQQRFKYEKKYAYVISSGGIRTKLTDGIWLKTAESECANSNWIGQEWTGACEGDDEILVNYEYHHDNLHLTGVVVTAKNEDGIVVSQRTCYEYDIYGNKIGEIPPRENSQSCD